MSIVYREGGCPLFRVSIIRGSTVAKCSIHSTNVKLILQCTVHSEDYKKLSVNLEFGSCETRRCVNISIADDLINEPVEKFSLSLSANTEYHLSLFPTSAEVVIIDDDGK